MESSVHRNGRSILSRFQFENRHHPLASSIQSNVNTYREEEVPSTTTPRLPAACRPFVSQQQRDNRTMMAAAGMEFRFLLCHRANWINVFIISLRDEQADIIVVQRSSSPIYIVNVSPEPCFPPPLSFECDVTGQNRRSCFQQIFFLRLRFCWPSPFYSLSLHSFWPEIAKAP